MVSTSCHLPGGADSSLDEAVESERFNPSKWALRVFNQKVLQHFKRQESEGSGPQNQAKLLCLEEIFLRSERLLDASVREA